MEYVNSWLRSTHEFHEDWATPKFNDSTVNDLIRLPGTVGEVVQVVPFHVKPAIVVILYLVQPCMVVLPVLQYALYGTISVVWGQGLETDVL